MSTEKEPLNHNSSWRAIQQNVHRSSVTPHSQTRHWQYLVRYAIFTVVCIILSFFAYIAVYGIYYRALPGFLSPASEPLRFVNFSSNGALKARHIKHLIGINKDTSLLNIDIYDIQEKISKLSQVKSCTVERVFPDTLNIVVEEHKPFFKAIVFNSLGRREGYLISEDGKVFKGYGYSAAKLKRLLFLTGVPKGVKIIESSHVAHVDALADLIKEAEYTKPHLLKDWISISMEYMPFGPEISESFLIVKTRSTGDIYFEPRNFADQLERLDSILKYTGADQLHMLERVDLTLKGQAAVKVAGKSH